MESCFIPSDVVHHFSVVFMLISKMAFLMRHLYIVVTFFFNKRLYGDLFFHTDDTKVHCCLLILFLHTQEAVMAAVAVQ